MATGRFSRVRELFEAALEQAEDGRAGWLDSQCAGDTDLRSRVAQLLDAHGAPVLFADPTLNGTARGELRPGQMIGPYRIIEEIGHGGFGVVLRAEQREPMRRTVALKVLKPGMDSREVLTRFEMERQALAIMEHPYIASVFEAGVTFTGRPWIAMELVAGEPVDRYCDRHGLRVRRRLELFGRICEGVQHAHQKGVIHRDLKPSNILVGDSGGEPQPRIIDFGVAKATGPGLTDATLLTRAHELIGTPVYTSPEQLQSATLGVDTRADVYSLGVLLYQLLAGSTPVDRTTLTGRSLLEIQKLILEQEPPRPSVRIAAAGADVNYKSSHGSDRAALVHEVGGDLDWIVMKALEKDRTRRYATVTDLARDVERFLRDEPVEARPPSTIYRLGKFARRHRAWAAAACVAVVALLAGFGVALYGLVHANNQAELARIQEQRARRVVRELRGVFESVDPLNAKGAFYTVRQLLDDYSEHFPADLAEDPMVESELRYTMGRAYEALGEFQRAEPQLRRAADIAREQHGADSADAARAIIPTCRVRHRLGATTDAARDLAAALDTLRRKAGPSHPDTLEAMLELSSLRIAQDKGDEAAALAEEATKSAAGSLELSLKARTALAAARGRQGRAGESLALAEEALREARSGLGEKHPVTQAVQRTLASARSRAEQNPSGKEAFESQLRSLVKQLGMAHPDTVRQALAQLRALIDSGQRDEARTRFLQIGSAARTAADFVLSTQDAAPSLLARYSADFAPIQNYAPFVTPALDVARAVLEPGSAQFAWYLRLAGHFYFVAGLTTEAEPVLREAVALCRKVSGPAAADTAETYCYLQDLLALTDRFSEADALLSRQPPEGWTTSDWAGLLHGAGVCRRAQNRSFEATQLLEMALEMRRALPGAETAVLETLTSLAELHMTGGFPAAQTRAAEAAVIAGRLYGEKDERTLSLRALAVRALRTRMNHPGLLPEFEKLAADAAGLPEGNELRINIQRGLTGAREESENAARAVQSARAYWQQQCGTTGMNSRIAITAREKLAQAMVKYSPPEEALEEIRAVRRQSASVFAPDHPWPLGLHTTEAAVLRQIGRWEESAAEFAASLKAWEPLAPLEDSGMGVTLREYSMLLRMLLRLDEFWQLLDGFEDRRNRRVWPKEATAVMVPHGAWWRYTAAAEGLSPEWNRTGFSDRTWLTARGWFVRGRTGTGTIVPPSPGYSPKRGTVCFRTTFDVTDPGALQQLKLRLSCDDGAVIWINGREVVRHRVVAGSSLEALATGEKGDAGFAHYPHSFVADAGLLNAGRNVIAVEVHNAAGNSALLWFDLQVEALRK